MVDNEDKARCTKIDTDEFNNRERETASSKDQASTGVAGRVATRARWERETLAPSLEQAPERQDAFTTMSARPVERIYGPEDLPDLDYDSDIGAPGEFPYTRGVHATGYRGKLWTMRQFAGFGTPEETNTRYKKLLNAGVTGLSVAFDLPTLMGRDPDDPVSLGEVGKCGVSVSSLVDMEKIFEGISLADVSVSMTINSPAAVLFAMYLTLAERQGVSREALSGTLQNDILKEYIAQKEYIFPPRPAMRLVVDTVAFCTEQVPRWNSISVSGYHIREAGATALQELVFTIANGIEYVQHGIDAGLDVDDFAPRISFFFNAQSDFFEEIAKYRAARRIWADVMRWRFGAKTERAWKLRFHAQTAGASLTATQPYNNVIRTALQSASAVLGGANSLHTNSLDEALALPTEKAATLALRTQQVIAEESGMPDIVDPFGGSYFIERMTLDLTREAKACIEKIDREGGMVAAIERGNPQQEIGESAYRFQQAVDRGEEVTVGVNVCRSKEEQAVPILQVDESVADQQCLRIRKLRVSRDDESARTALDKVRIAASGSDNMMYPLLEAVEKYCTIGEICNTLRSVWGEYEEPQPF